MAKNVQLFTPVNYNQPGSTRKPVQIDWSLCCLCQENKKDVPLQEPKSTGLDTLAFYIIEFHKINELPHNLNMNHINDGSGISQTLFKNNAKWHKNCKNSYCEEKFKRAKGRLNKRKAEYDSTDCPSGVKTRRKDKPIPASNKEICFFCEETSKKDNLIEALTSNVDAKVRKYVHELGDKRLIGKLSSGDMRAIDAMYHLKCLMKLKNKYVSRLREKKKCDKQNLTLSNDAIAFAELVAYIEDTREIKDVTFIFELNILSAMYKKRLAELNNIDIRQTNVHSGRLKTKLLKHIPDLRSQKKGKQSMLIFSQDIAHTIQHAINNDEDAVTLMKAAKIIRKDIFSKAYEFSGSFEENCERNAVSKSLNTLVRMILEGPNIENENHCNEKRDHISVTMSELLQFNTVKRSRAKDGIRHSTVRESPLPIYLSMLIHAKTRSKNLIDTMFNLGLCVSYDRLMNISTNLANSVCDQYHIDQVVCPPQLSKGVFTCGAVDNIDHNPSARTAHDSFHGTAISITQFPTSELPKDGQDRVVQAVVKRSKISPLPQKYTVVPSVTGTSDPVVPTKYGSFIVDQSIISEDNIKEREWLSQLALLYDKETLADDDYLSWAAFHANNQPELEIIPSLVTLLPLFREKAQSTCMIKHAMQMVSDAIKHVNPTQIPVIYADQPLYAILKQIQWTWPETHGEDKIVAMMGGLHIEMNLLKLLGDWLRGSGWVASLIQADITTSGRAESMLSGSHVTRTRYAHQVTAGSLKILQERAYQQYLEKEENDLRYEEWCDKQCQEQPQFKYWAIVLYLELLVLQFIRSIRERNFPVYIQSLLQIVSWLFALDHINYARWLPVHITDMVNLIRTHPGVYYEFMKGHFTGQRTNKVFSAMSIDQCHEQMNKLVKGEGGAIGLTEDPQALERWMVAGPEISRLILEFENSYQNLESQSSKKHHEQNPTTQKKFAKDVKALVDTLEEMGNPFLEDNGDLLTLDTKIIMSKEVIQTINTIEENGQKQYNTFLSERLSAPQNMSLSKTITKNNYPLFSKVSVKQPSKIKEQVKYLESNCKLFSGLYIGSQFRQGNTNNFFAVENTPFPRSISEMGQQYVGKKSELLDCFEQCVPSNKVKSDVDATVLDGAFIVHKLKPLNSRTFEEYAMNIFKPFILRELNKVERLDVIWDRYFPDSLKQSTREKRKHLGTAQRRRVLSGSPVPSNWDSFLRIDANKDELFHFLSESMETYNTGGKVLISTYDEKVMTTVQDTIMDIDSLQPCSHEEADTRIFLHVKHCAQQGHKRISIQTVDTDVVVLAIGHFQSLNIEELWIDFGVLNHYRNIAAHDIANYLNEKAKALLLFHALTGCDTVSSFRGRGKKTAWSAWMAHPAATDAFESLLSQPEDLTPELIHKIERFVVLMYSKTSTLSRVNEARKELFTQFGRTIDNIPPTQGTLINHLKRSVYQGSYIWAQALELSPNLPSPEYWGYKSTSLGWIPHWTDLQDATASCSELVRCGCIKGCKKNCKCHKKTPLYRTL